MSTQRYPVTPHPIETLLTWVKSGEIAIPEIQRPFVWEPVKVRTLPDSLYQGYPVGYLIAWRNRAVRLKDGSTSKGKRILPPHPTKRAEAMERWPPAGCTAGLRPATLVAKASGLRRSAQLEQPAPPRQVPPPPRLGAQPRTLQS
jgi:hypothetical protein